MTWALWRGGIAELKSVNPQELSSFLPYLIVGGGLGQPGFADIWGFHPDIDSSEGVLEPYTQVAVTPDPPHQASGTWIKIFHRQVSSPSVPIAAPPYGLDNIYWATPSGEVFHYRKTLSVWQEIGG